MKLRSVLVPAVVFGAALTISLPASATATFDPDSGSGFVGKGDVQVPFGWNNDQLQKNAAGVDFVYTDSTTYDVTCEQKTTETFTTGPAHNRRTHTRPVVVTDVYDEATAISYDTATSTRKNAKGAVNGFFLSGKHLVASDGLPAAGDVCEMEDGSAGTISEDPAVVTDTTGDTLAATHAASGKSAIVWTDGVSTL